MHTERPSRPVRSRIGTGGLAGAVAVLVVLPAALLVGCTKASARRQPASFRAHGSVEQIWVTGAAPRQPLAVVNAKGKTVARQDAAANGSVLFRGLEPGGGYRVRQRVRGAETESPELEVLSTRPAPPSTLLYQQRLATGYGYLTTRDGTTLAVNVQLPGPPDKGPYPTLVEYSGYGYANPAGGESSIAQIPQLFGYAVVDVNMRGTGCSGGAFDYFEPLQSLDGYDVIETVARQPWVLHHRVGMVGVSYGGISQLFVAATAPPHLAAITPLSVIDNTATTLYPGGILNRGFALSWARDRVHDAEPASATGGQKWAYERIQAGDKTCAANQVMHAHARDLMAQIRANAHYDPKVADPLNPTTFVHKIKAPVFLACQWEDEQTGGHCPELASRFRGSDHKWFTFTNGTHIDSLDPATFNRWYDFLELYVAQRAPHLPDAVKALAPTIFQAAMGVAGVQLPPDPIQAQPDYARALAAFEKLPAVRILFDNGAGAAPGAPVAAFEQSFPSWPVPGTRPGVWYFGPDGSLTDTKPSATTSGTDAFDWNPGARPSTDFSGSGSAVWAAAPDYRWLPLPAGTAVSYVSAPLAHDTVVIGSGSVDLWLRSTAADSDLQVTLSEVRPDGQELFVQNGWLRASDRKLDENASNEIEAKPTYRARDVEALPAGRWAKVRVPLYYSGHAFRAGSKIRVTVEAPGGDQPFWEFDVLQPKGPVTNSVARTPLMPSRLVLPVVPGVSVPTPLPASCSGLRGQPCRPFRPAPNRPGIPAPAASAS